MSAWSRGEGCLPGPGGCLHGGCLPGLGGICLVWGGSAWSVGCLLGLGGCLLGPGGLPGRGGLASQHALRQTPSPPCGQTHTCKNITLATTSLRPVINQELCFNIKATKVFNEVSVSGFILALHGHVTMSTQISAPSIRIGEVCFMGNYQNPTHLE